WTRRRNDKSSWAESDRRSQDLLRRAQSFHEPTRAFYFVRRDCHRFQGNAALAEADDTSFKTAVARTAWDYFLPGHSAGWGGDFEEAVLSYKAALALQPNHFDSLYFLADRLAENRLNRKAEALQLYTACIALRPGASGNCYVNRGALHHELGHL